MDTRLTVRPYAPIDDYDMIAGWWIAHGHPVISDHLLSPIGFVAGMDGRDQVAVFVYFDRHVPVCFLGNIVSAPGLTAAQVADAGEAAIECAKDLARAYGTRVMRVYVPRAISRYAQRGGFQVDERELVNISCELQEEDLCLGHQQ
jgi:hypothetical protein